jgi:biopolymer transport protein ExbD
MRKIVILSALFFLMSLNSYATESTCANLPETTEAETLTKADCYNDEIERLMAKINYEDSYVATNPEPSSEPELVAQDPWGSGGSTGSQG